MEMGTTKYYKLWHMLVAFVVGALVASAVILVPAMGGAGFIGVKDLAVEEEEEPQFGLSFAKEYPIGSSEFDKAASEEYKTLSGLEVLFDSANKTAFMFGPKGNVFAVKQVDSPKSVDLRSLSAMNFTDALQGAPGDFTGIKVDAIGTGGVTGLVAAKDLKIGSEAFDLAASEHYIIIAGLEVLSDSAANRAYMFAPGGAMFSVSRVTDVSKLNLSNFDARNFYDCWPKSL